MRENYNRNYFDEGYGLVFSTTGPGTFIISTTSADFLGYSIVCSASGATIRIYDSISAASGNIVAQNVLGATVTTESGRFSQIKCKKGIVLFSTLSTGASQIIYFGPKG